MTLEVLSFGCRLNGVEAQVMRERAAAAGLSDAVIVNTCAVTAEAVRQAGQAIRRAARTRSGRPVIVTGCAAEIEPARFAAVPGVAAVLANGRKTDRDVWAALAGRPSSVGGPPVAAFAAASDAGAERVRSFVRVQSGCDHRCTFCVIPFGRGPSRSAEPADVVASVRDAVARGAREVVLTGVDLTAWGGDLGREGRLDREGALGQGGRLGRLVAAVLREVPELPRLRLSSLDAVELDEELLDALARETRLMPHLHLSLQAGDDLVLKRMGRRHRRADALALCRRLRELRPDVALGADLIAGFPTETDAMFERSLDLVEACGLAFLHVFPFSARPGTPAARMPPVPAAVVRERAARLRRAGEAALARHLDRRLHSPLRVLAENAQLGRAEDFTPVRFGRPARRGEISEIVAAGHDGRALLAS